MMKKMSVNFLVAMLTVMITGAVAIGNVGVDIQGVIISNQTATTPLGCAVLCDQTSSCVAWSWNSCTGQTCTLYSQAAATSFNQCKQSSAVVGVAGVDRPGSPLSGYNPYIFQTQTTASTCHSMCLNITNCVAWAFDNVGRVNCFLKSSIPSEVSNSSVTSGVVGNQATNIAYAGLSTIIIPANGTATQCSEFCAQTPNCKAWLYSPPNSACGTTFQAFCWAKTVAYAPSENNCFVSGTQPISTAVTPPNLAITPAVLVKNIPKPSFPFTQVVAFGDNLSDNGNGSYAHCVQVNEAQHTDCGNSIYGWGTWCNGPVAISYLSGFLGTPLTLDYAFGHGD